MVGMNLSAWDIYGGLVALFGFVMSCWLIWVNIPPSEK
jgi:hypothetical protein